MSQPLVLNDFETIQRAENGGSPLINETASYLHVGHGTPVVIMPKRKLLALLKKAKQTTTDNDFSKAIEDYLADNDGFYKPVVPEEIYSDTDDE